MQATDLEFQTKDSPTAAAFNNLQTAILRLASKPPIRLGSYNTDNADNT